MTTRPADLPEFELPPIVEVFLSVQFAELERFRIAHLGLLWDRKFRSAFPHLQERPPIPPQYETFGPTEQMRLEVTAMQSAPVPRVWFMTDPQNPSEVVQFQTNRFTHNWRKGGDPYPRFEYIRDKFFEELDSLNRFLDEEKLGEILPDQCEISYINLIALPNKANEWENYSSVIAAICTPSSRNSGARLPQLEDASFGARFVLDDSDGERRGRLLVGAQKGHDGSGKSLIRFELTARGAPKDTDTASIKAFYELGRETIVRSFAALTTDEMHGLWRRVK